MKWLPYVALVVLGLFLLFYSTQTGELGDEWVSYHKAVSMSERTGKEIFLFVFSPTCPKCQYFKSEVFSKEDVMEIISQKYIPSYIDTSKEVPPINVIFVPTFCVGYAGEMRCFQAADEEELLSRLGLDQSK